MSAFTTGLLNRISQGIDQRLQDRRAEELQEKAFQTNMRQQQALLPFELDRRKQIFDQDQALQLQAQPQALAMKETEMRRIAEIKQKLDEEASKIPLQTTPGLREALSAGQIPGEELLQTQGDVDFVNAYLKTFRQMFQADPDRVYEKQSAIEKARIESFREKEKIRAANRPAKTPKTPKAPKPPVEGKLTDVQKAELRKYDGELRRYQDRLLKEESYSDPDLGMIETLRSRINELETKRQKVLKPPTGQVSDAAKKFLSVIENLRNTRKARGE